MWSRSSRSSKGSPTRSGRKSRLRRGRNRRAARASASRRARAQGRRSFLLAHSMGNWALQVAVETWFAHGNGDAAMFDEALLSAPDEVHSTFEFGPFARLSALTRLSRRLSHYL